MPFRGHTPRQHRASSSKGGKRRMRRVTRKQQLEWSRKGGEANKARIAAARARQGLVVGGDNGHDGG